VKPAPFEYFAPESLGEVVSLLEQHGSEARLLAGGQSLVPLMALRLATPSVIVDINRLPDLGELSLDGDVLEIGALARHRSAELSPDLRNQCPMIGEAVDVIGHVAIRNRGTIVGSMAHADPAAEWPAIALSLGAEFDVLGSDGARSIPSVEFFVSYFSNSLQPNEMVTRVRLRIPGGRVGSAFLELARRRGDFALVGAATLLVLASDGRIQEARIALIGVAETALRISAGEALLVGESPSEALFENAASEVGAAIEPPTDGQASGAYRRSIARVLTHRALRLARERAERP
jgi:carbon-monoxide dehydrogenase medium subunit